MRVNEGRKSSRLPSIKMKARAAVGRKEKNLLCDPGAELLSFSMEEEREAKKSAKKVQMGREKNKQ